MTPWQLTKNVSLIRLRRRNNIYVEINIEMRPCSSCFQRGNHMAEYGVSFSEIYDSYVIKISTEIVY